MFAFRLALSANPMFKIVLPVLLLIGIMSTGAYRKPWRFENHWRSDLLFAHQLLTTAKAGKQAQPAGSAPQRQVPPGYPAVLAGFAVLDPRVATGLACYGLQGENCTMAAPFGIIVGAQIAAGVATLVFVFLLAIELTGSRMIGILTVTMFILMGRLGEHARFLEQDNFHQLLMFAGFLAAATGYRKHPIALSACAGVLIGAAALFHPYYVYLLMLVPLAMAAWVHARGADPGTARTLVVGQIAFAVCGLLVVMPWAVRNLVLFGDPMLSDVYESYQFAQRIAYNGMTAPETLLAMIHWIPTNGDDLARFLFGSKTRVQLGGTGPGTYFHAGQGIYSAAAAASAGRNPMYWLLTEHPSYWRHLAVTPSIFTRGMWGSHGFMAYIGMACLPRLARHLRASSQRDAGLTVMIAAGLLTLVHALLTPNFYWFNAPMLFVMALATSHALATLSASRPRFVNVLIGAGMLIWGGMILLRLYRNDLW